MCIVNGTIRPTPVPRFPGLNNITSPNIPREDATVEVVEKIRANLSLPQYADLFDYPRACLLSRHLPRFLCDICVTWRMDHNWHEKPDFYNWLDHVGTYIWFCKALVGPYELISKGSGSMCCQTFPLGPRRGPTFSLDHISWWSEGSSLHWWGWYKLVWQVLHLIRRL